MKQVLRVTLSVLLLGLMILPTGLFGREKDKGIKVQLLFDRGLEGKTADQKTQLNQLSDYFEKCVAEIFTNNGVPAGVITSRNQFDPASGQYLLTVKTVNYNPGSKAARMMVGLGAGATSLDIHFELFGSDKTPLLAKDHGRGSSRDWKYLCKALGKDMLDAVEAAVTPKKEPAK